MNKGSQTHDYKDRLVSGVPSQLPLHQSTRARKHCSDLSMQMLDQFYSMCWLVLARDFGYPISGHDCQHLGSWDVLAGESWELLCCWKTTQLLHRHSQPSMGLLIPLSICIVIFQFLNTSRLSAVSTSQAPKFLLP